MPQLSYFKVIGTWEPSSPKGIINGDVTFTMLIENNGVLAAPTLDNPAVVVPTVVHSIIDNNTLQPVSLLANTAVLNLTGTLYYMAEFSNVSYSEPGKPEAGLTVGPITFAASPDTTPIDLVFVTPAAGSPVTQTVLPSTLAAYITDATTLGRQLLTVPDAATALSDLGLGGLTTTLGLVNTALQPSAVINNADGTLSVTGVNSLEPLSTVTIVTTSTAPTIGQTTYYNAASGNLTPTLPALSGLRVGARFAVRRDPADVSQNTVILTCAGSDTFYSSGATTATLPLSGEQREYQVISVSETKYWAPSGAINPIAALDNRYLSGASKLVSIGDNGLGTTLVGAATSTIGTSEMMFTVGLAAAGIAPEWIHWYSASGTAYDTYPSGPITFSASLQIVSSTNPGTVTGVLYPLMFHGRTAATLDPGGKIIAEPLEISVAPGDVVAVRTYLSSGTAYAPRVTNGPPNVTGWGGFTAGSDLTAPGSAVIPSLSGLNYGPANLNGYAAGGGNAKSAAMFGDSIGIGAFDVAFWTVPAIGGQAGFAIRALTGKAGLLNLSLAGDEAAWFQGSRGSLLRGSLVSQCNSGIIEYGANDIFNGLITAAQLEAYNLNIAIAARRKGLSRMVLTTLTPRTTSTDYWATTANQSTVTGESQRVAYNTWVRAGCPIDPTTLAPVAVGTSHALLTGSFGHPITGFFDVASKVESSLNSGKWLPAQRVATGSITSGSIQLNSTTANFTTPNQEAGGDTGTTIALLGAGVSGSALVIDIGIVGSSTLAYLGGTSSAAVTNAQLNVGVMTVDGDHPSAHGHYLMSTAVDLTML